MSYVSFPDPLSLLVDLSDRVFDLEQSITNPALFAGPWHSDVVFINSWANFGGGFGGFQYMLSSTGMVFLDGLVMNTVGVAAGGSSIITGALPAAYRPISKKMRKVLLGNSAGTLWIVRLDIDTAGNLTFVLPAGVSLPAGGNGFVSLACSWPTNG